MCHGHTASQCFTCGVNEVMKLLSSLLPVFLALAAVNSNADLLCKSRVICSHCSYCLAKESSKVSK